MKRIHRRPSHTDLDQIDGTDQFLGPTRFILANIFHGIADLELLRDDLEQAAAACRRSLRLCIELARPVGPQYCVGGLAALAATAGDMNIAGELWGAAERLERELGIPLLPSQKRRYEELIRAHTDPGSIAFAAAAERGSKMSADEIYAYALNQRVTNRKAPPCAPPGGRESGDPQRESVRT